MANTAYLAIQKPTAGGDSDAWGGYLNTGLDTIDRQFLMFGAKNASAQSLTSNTQTDVAFGTELYDTGTAFASSTFTAPISGVYRFFLTIAGGGDSALLRLAGFLKVNGATTYTVFDENGLTGTSGQGAISGNMLLSLTAGDTVKARTTVVATGTVALTDGGCQFSGEFIHT